MYLEQLTNTLKNERSYRIVFLGDSITSAEWIHPNWRDVIEYVLKEELSEKLNDQDLPYWGIRCINSGFEGSTTRDWLSKIKTDVLDYKPDMVIVMGTINDADLEIPSDETKNNIEQLLNALTPNVISVIYSTDLATNNDDYNQKYQEHLSKVTSLFPRNNVLFINMYEEFKKLDLNRFFTFKSPGNDVVGIKLGDLDFIHPNQLGNAYIAKVILDKVFSIKFNPEKYIRENNEGKMFPSY